MAIVSKVGFMVGNIKIGTLSSLFSFGANPLKAKIKSLATVSYADIYHG